MPANSQIMARFSLSVDRYTIGGHDSLQFVVKDTGVESASRQSNRRRCSESFCRRTPPSPASMVERVSGLAITDRFVQMMEGRITVESELGVGSTSHDSTSRKSGS